MHNAAHRLMVSLMAQSRQHISVRSASPAENGLCVQSLHLLTIPLCRIIYIECEPSGS